MSQDVLTASQAAALLHLDVEVLRRETASGSIPGQKVGRQYRYYRGALIAWLSRPCVESSQAKFPTTSARARLVAIENEGRVRRFVRSATNRETVANISRAVCLLERQGR